MDFVACIKQFVKDRGVEEIAKRSFIGFLGDYQAFENESPSFKLILNHWSGNGKLEKISMMSAKDSQWIIDTSNIIHQTESEGFKKEMVSELLHKLLLGIGVVNSKFDWEKEFMPKEPTNTPLSSKRQTPQTKNQSVVETLTKETLKQQEIDKEWQKIQNQQQRDRKKAERVAKRAQSKKEKEKKKAILKSALKKDGHWLDDSEKQAFEAYMKKKEMVAKVCLGITIGMALLLLVSVIVYCYCLIVGSSNASIWGVFSLVSIGGGMVSAICAGIVSPDHIIHDVFFGIAGVMAGLLVVGLIVILWGWISGSGHKPVWNILSLVGLCAGLVCVILGTVLDG